MGKANAVEAKARVQDPREKKRKGIGGREQEKKKGGFGV
jgi:hypothetical protein